MLVSVLVCCVWRVPTLVCVLSTFEVRGYLDPGYVFAVLATKLPLSAWCNFFVCWCLGVFRLGAVLPSRVRWLSGKKHEHVMCSFRTCLLQDKKCIAVFFNQVAKKWRIARFASILSKNRCGDGLADTSRILVALLGATGTAFHVASAALNGATVTHRALRLCSAGTI